MSKNTTTPDEDADAKDARERRALEKAKAAFDEAQKNQDACDDAAAFGVEEDEPDTLEEME